MREFSEHNSTTCSDQKELLYTIHGRVGGLDYDLELLTVRTDGSACQAKFTLEDVESSLTEVSMPDERLLDFIADCFAQKMLKAVYDEGTIIFELTAPVGSHEVTLSLPPSGSMKPLSPQLAAKLSANMAFSLTKRLQQSDQTRKRPEVVSPDQGSSAKRGTGQASASPVTLETKDITTEKAASSAPSSTTKAGPTSSTPHVSPRAKLGGPVRTKGRGRPGALTFGKPS